MTTGVPWGASERSREGLSCVGSLVTATTRISAGSRGGRRPSRRSFQKLSQTVQPDVKNASSVGGYPSPKPIFTGSRSSVRPMMSLPSRMVARRAGEGSSAPRFSPSPEGGPSRRRISAWLRSNPATSSTSRASSTVSQATRTVMPSRSALARDLLHERAGQAAPVVRARGVVDRHAAVAVEPIDRGRVLAHHHPAADWGDAADLCIALPVAKNVAVHAALPAVAIRAPAVRACTREMVAVHVVAHALGGAQPASAVRGAHPPTADVGVGGADVLAVVDLAAKGRIAVVAQAAATRSGADCGPGAYGPRQVANRRNHQCRANDSRAHEQPPARSLPLQQRASCVHEPIGHRAAPDPYDPQARGTSV